MRITRNVREVLERITDDVRIVCIGELLNSRSAIQFIMDHLDVLMLSDPKRKTYLLTSFLPKDAYFKLNPKARMQTLDCFVNSPHFRDKRKSFMSNMDVREYSRSKEETLYTALNLYRFLYSKGVIIKSIETVAKDNPNDVRLYRGMLKNDMSAIQQRISGLNWFAVNEVRSILKRDSTARIIVYAGMAFTNDTTFVKFDNQGEYMGELSLKGMCSQFSEQYKALNIATHEIGLCCDAELLVGVDMNVDCFSRYSLSHNILNVDKADCLLLTESVSKCSAELRERFDSVFYPGEERTIKMLSNDEVRKMTLSALLKSYQAESVKQLEQNPPSKKKRKRKKKKSQVSPANEAPASAFPYALAKMEASQEEQQDVDETTGVSLRNMRQ